VNGDCLFHFVHTCKKLSAFFLLKLGNSLVPFGFFIIVEFCLSLLFCVLELSLFQIRLPWIVLLNFVGRKGLTDVPDCLGSCCCDGFDRKILLVSLIVLARAVTIAQTERLHWCCSE
jgi:hypothetical protein